MKYEINITKQVQKDIKSLSPKQKEKLKWILSYLISEDPYNGKKLLDDLTGNYSYRLNIRDNIIYSINEKMGIVYAKRAHTHYGQ